MTVLNPGLSAMVREIVGDDATADHVGSGDVPVLGTPFVLTLVERAAVAAVALRLDPRTTSVGSRVELEHVAPTPVGGRVSAAVRLEEVEGRRLRFSFEVRDGAGIVARGIHERVIVDRERFLETAGARA